MNTENKNGWRPSSQQRAVLEILRDESAENQAEFCRNFCTFTSSKLTKILNVLETDENGKPKPSYFDDIADPEALMEEIEELVASLPAKRLAMENTRDIEVLPTSSFRAAVVAAKQCKLKKNAERVIQYIAPTRGGKTTLHLYLQQKLRVDFHLAFVNCRSSWRPANADNRLRAEYTVLKDICTGLGLRIHDNKRRSGVPGITDAIVEALCNRAVLMVVDEARFLATASLNLFIDLLNRSRVVILTQCTPIASTRMHQWYKDEAEQFDGRTHKTIRVNEIPVSDVELFFPEKNKFEDAPAMHRLIADKASQFGHFSLIARTKQYLQTSTRAEEKEVRAALEKALAEMNHSDSKS